MTPSDPSSWEYHSGYEIYYRSTTAAERSTNRWHAGSLLVVDTDLLSDVLGGATNANLHVPLALESNETPTTVLTVEPISLEKGRTSSQAPVYSAVGTTVTVRRPDFYSFFVTGATQSDPGDAIVHLVAEETRGFYATVGLEDRRVAIRGPFVETIGVTRIDIDPPLGNEVILVETSIIEDPWFFVQFPEHPTNLSVGEQAAVPYAIDELAASPRKIRDAARTLQCADGLDNDPDGKADNCDYDCLPHPDYGGDSIDHVVSFEYTKNLAVLPDTSLCTCAPLSCAATIKAIGDEAAMLLNALNPPPSAEYELGTRAPPIRVRLVAEFINGGGCVAAEACDANSTGADCDVDYPFAKTAGDLNDMRVAAWEGVTTAASVIAKQDDVHPVSLVGVIAKTVASTNAGLGGYDPLTGFFSLGAATIRFDFNGDAAFNGQRLAHEIGHCFGLQHDDAFATPAGAMVEGLSFMNSFPGNIPILGGDESGTDFLPGESNWETWATRPWSPIFPRPSGFGHTGCSSDAECQPPEFPNMVCGGSGPKTFCAF